MTELRNSHFPAQALRQNGVKSISALGVLSVPAKHVWTWQGRQSANVRSGVAYRVTVNVELPEQLSGWPVSGSMPFQTQSADAEIDRPSVAIVPLPPP